MKTVFLDRDGVINEDLNFVGTIDRFIFLPRAIEAIKLLNENEFKVVVITNQSGIARGHYTKEDTEILHEYVNNYMKPFGAKIDKFYYCPHHPDDNCECRKPKPGMFFSAKKDLGIDLSKSFMIGDNKRDIEAGENAGVVSFLIDNKTVDILDIVHRIIMTLK